MRFVSCWAEGPLPADVDLPRQEIQSRNPLPAEGPLPAKKRTQKNPPLPEKAGGLMGENPRRKRENPPIKTHGKAAQDLAQPRKNGGKILSVIAAALFALGGIYYGILLFDSFMKMRYTIVQTEDSAVLVSKGLPPRSIPFLIALALLIVFAAVQVLALIRPRFTVIAALSAAVPLAFPSFTDVTLSEFTRVGLIHPVSLIKFIPFILACLLWAIAGILETGKE